MDSESEFRQPKYIMLTDDELVKLIICAAFDILEYAFPILLGPLIGDILDVAGFWAGIIMFGWIGCLAILEFVPFADYFPIFVIVWIVWYVRKKRREAREREKVLKKWM